MSFTYGAGSSLAAQHSLIHGMIFISFHSDPVMSIFVYDDAATTPQ
jgi:hypothetical protein